MASIDTSSFQGLRQTMEARWATLAVRERRLVTAALWLAALALLVLIGIRPAWRTLEQTPVQQRELGLQLDEMRRLADEAQALRNRPPVPPAQAEAALRAASDRLGPGARLMVQGDRATLVLESVSGEALATWLEEARAGARVRPLEATLNQTRPGQYAGNVVVALVPGPAAR
ncbi:type II secretion system protein GspM [uncultured Aquabacterium sp.]|jgi:general secretion pathway protein M|uniref:type II secretion system protein GspM n=1 Tax=uncultured Aquabacterium sp. TaxID=158753 RepID=UPI00261BEE0B|nr:type II secretion system protein GspM [uncultured Aquabacterium sp.]